MAFLSQDLGLVILCSRENEERAHIVAALEEYRVAGIPRYHRPEEIRRYLATQFQVPHQRAGLYHDQHVIWSAAAEVGRAEKYSYLAYFVVVLLLLFVRLLKSFFVSHPLP